MTKLASFAEKGSESAVCFKGYYDYVYIWLESPSLCETKTTQASYSKFLNACSWRRGKGRVTSQITKQQGPTAAQGAKPLSQTPIKSPDSREQMNVANSSFCPSRPSCSFTFFAPEPLSWAYFCLCLPPWGPDSDLLETQNIFVNHNLSKNLSPRVRARPGFSAAEPDGTLNTRQKKETVKRTIFSFTYFVFRRPRSQSVTETFRPSSPPAQLLHSKCRAHRAFLKQFNTTILHTTLSVGVGEEFLVRELFTIKK